MRFISCISSRLASLLSLGVLADAAPLAADAAPPEETYASGSEGAGAGSHRNLLPGGEAEALVVATADRRERRAGEGVVATDVVERSQIVTSGALDAAQALATTVGVQIERSFRGEALLLQGLDPQHALILVDGERLVGARDGAIDLSRFNALGIKQIEVVRGPASALYGADAMAGVVNLVTRTPEPGFTGEAQGRYGLTFHGDADNRAGAGERNDGQPLGHNGSAWAGASGGSENVRGRLSLGYRRSSAYDLAPENAATTGARVDDLDALGRAIWLASSRFELPLFARASRRELRAIDQNASGAIFDRTQRNEDLSLTLKPTLRFGAGRSLTLVGSYGVMRSQQLRDQRGDDDGDDYEDAREQLATMRAQSDLAFAARVTLSAGAELLGNDFRSPRLTERGQRGRISPYAQLEWTIHDKATLLAVAPGARVDADSQYGVNVSPRLAMRCDPVQALSLRAAVGRGFRAPSFSELLLDFQNAAANYRVRGNPDLAPERSLGVSVSVEARAGARKRSEVEARAGARERATEPRQDDWLQASVNLFRNELRDLIDTRLVSVIAGEQQFQYVNVHSARTQGLESRLLLKPHALVAIELNYALTHARDLDADRPLSGRALHRGSARVVLGGGLSGWSIAARCQVVGQREFVVADDAGATRTYETSPYAVVDARAALRVGDHVEPFLVAENLTGVGGTDLPLRPTTAYVGMNVYH